LALLRLIEIRSDCRILATCLVRPRRHLVGLITLIIEGVKELKDEKDRQVGELNNEISALADENNELALENLALKRKFLTLEARMAKVEFMLSQDSYSSIAFDLE